MPDIHLKNPHAKKGFWKRLSRHRGWGYPDVLQIRGSVLPSCVPILFFSTLFTTLLAVLYLIFEINITLPESLVRELDEADRKEKEMNIRLLLAYAVAIKHHLRLEFGTDWFDLTSLLPDGFQLTYFDGNVAQENTVLGAGHDEDPNRSVANRPSSDIPEHSLRVIANRMSPSTYKSLRNSYSRDETTIWFGASEWGSDIDASMSLPLEIIFHVGLYIDKKQHNGSLDGARFGAISGNLNSLVEIFGDLERISDTPIPFAYNIHLKQAVLLYVWVLPFTLVDKVGWAVIPTVFLVAFVLFGVEAIGAEIENPFGFDKNDLPLDGYCDDLKAEIEYLQRHIPSVKAIPASQSPR
ncbi:14812_t:CDS:2 [Funneliformis mosseae]|uniref:14812_t:CDS:1 n=1 Tax=Funneliformis mosseae TaxID=27381 RepID=A0A9N9FRN4_FUNMO|nr:14812_t:CDS:2 [Funneliformis mosseae]